MAVPDHECRAKSRSEGCWPGSFRHDASTSAWACGSAAGPGRGGPVTPETLGIVGDVPPGGRSNFRLPLPATGAGFVVTVHSFEFGVTRSP
jgi:hypothetical protein